jgi:hypothetical protein
MISLYGLMSAIVLGSSIWVLCDAAAMHARPSEWIYDPVSYIGKENPTITTASTTHRRSGGSCSVFFFGSLAFRCT